MSYVTDELCFMAGLTVDLAPDGDRFGQRRPPLYTNILQEYPSGQIFKEIIQNADDARATEVKFYLDCRHMQTLPHDLVKRATYSELDQFQGPALMSFNNAPFKEEDWDNIQNLQLSGKAKNPHKVGKFGIGFNSVYHITDLPVIISEDYCGFLEPQEHIWHGESGKGYTLRRLRQNYPAVLHPFDGVGDFSMHSPSTFDGKTLFRFPLRNRASKLSNEVYTVEKLRKLLEALKAEAKYLLLFLRSVCSIEVVEISESRKSKQVFKVCISSRDSTKHQSEQQLLVERVESTFTGDSPYAVKQVIQQTVHFNIEMIDGSVKRGYEWIVVHRIGSDNPKVLTLAEKQHVLPCVGTAFEVSNTGARSKGRTFCFLPLPTEDKTPFAIHVNGTFAVSSNRRSLKWEAQERQDDQEATWNKLLVQYCVPHCYAQLIQELVKLPSLPHETVYNCWPSLSDVRGTPWEEILKPLFSSILQSKNIVYTPVNSGEWIAITEAMFVLESEKVPRSVIEVILMCGVKVVELSQELWNIILHYKSQNVQQIDPSIVRNALKGNLKAYQSRSCKEKMTILSYCLKDIRYAELEGLELLPLANKCFTKFKRNDRNDQLYLCSKDIPYTLLPGLENMMVDNELPIFKELKDVAQSGLTQLQVLGVREVIELLSLSKPQSWSQKQLKHFWNWLQNHDLNLFDGQCIVPVKLSSGHTKILPLAKKQGIVYISQHTSYIMPGLMTSLFKFGIKLADAREFSYLTHPNINKHLYRFEAGEILDALQPFDLSKTKLSCSEAIGFQNFLSTSLAVGILSEMDRITLSKCNNCILWFVYVTLIYTFELCME